jgi:hypothetical protein
MNCLETYNIDLNKVIEYNYHNYFVYSTLLLFSFYLIYFGNKIIKPTLFITGLSSSLLIQNSATNFLVHNNIISGNINCNTYAGINLAFGLFFGSLLCYFYRLSIFLLGSVSFGSITYLGTNIINKYDTVPVNYEYIIVGVSSLIGGSLSLKYIEKLSIIITVLFGSFLGMFSFNKLINENSLGKYIYVYIPIYVLFSIHGIYIQNMRKNKNKAKPLLENNNKNTYQ